MTSELTDPIATEQVRRLQGGQRRIATIVRPDGAHPVESADDELHAVGRSRSTALAVITLGMPGLALRGMHPSPSESSSRKGR